MPVRFRFRPVVSTPGTVLYNYWGAQGYSRPVIDVQVVGPTGDYVNAPAHLDSAADFVVFDDGVARHLGLRPPFARTTQVSGIAGAASSAFTLPPDGTVSLFLTDYIEYYFLPGPPIGFWSSPGAAPPGLRRSVLGTTGFLQYFDVRFFHSLQPPEVELVEVPGFPGRHGAFPGRTPLRDFIRQLKLGP